MPKFYFTYGTDGQPFVGGWTEVDALTATQPVLRLEPTTLTRPRAS